MLCAFSFHFSLKKKIIIDIFTTMWGNLMIQRLVAALEAGTPPSHIHMWILSFRAHSMSWSLGSFSFWPCPSQLTLQSEKKYAFLDEWNRRTSIKCATFSNLFHVPLYKINLASLSYLCLKMPHNAWHKIVLTKYWLNEQISRKRSLRLTATLYWQQI